MLIAAVVSARFVGLALALFACATPLRADGSPPGANSPPAGDAVPVAPGPGTIGQQPPPLPQVQPLPILPSPLFDRIPEARQTPAPDWIKPGTRLVFFSTNAVTQTNPGQMGMRRDPNGKIIDDQGNRWTMTDPTGESGGGVGYTVLDIIASEPGVLVMQSHLYFLPQGTQGPAVLSGNSAVVCHPSGCDFFLHPRLLAQVPTVDAPGINIIRQQYDLNNRRYGAIRVTLSKQGVSSSVYDLTSGVLLFSRSAQQQSQGQVLDPRGNSTNAGATATGTHTFMATRPLNLPWTNSQMPAWVKQAHRLRYAGQMISRPMNETGLGDLSTPVSSEMILKQTGANWSLHELVYNVDTNVGVPNVPSRSEIATGAASIDGVWKDPKFLQQLRSGQPLDQDTTVGTQTIVEYAGAGSDGRAIVAITTTTAQQKSTNVYDAADGKLVQVIRTQSNPGTNLLTITQMNLVGME